MSETEPVQITHRCPKEACRCRIRTAADHAGRLETPCPACGETVVLQVPEELTPHRRIRQCALCPGHEFFIRKDFPQRLGLILVVIFALVASFFYYRENVLATFGVLAGLVLIDAVIYCFVGRVTVCYRCRAEYRRVAYNADYKGFDLATSEKYP